MLKNKTKYIFTENKYRLTINKITCIIYHKLLIVTKIQEFQKNIVIIILLKIQNLESLI